MAGGRPVPTHLSFYGAIQGNGRSPHEPKPEIPAKQPAPPAFLDDYALAEWKRVAPELWRMGLLTHVDVAALAVYCTSYAQWRTAVQALRTMGR